MSRLVNVWNAALPIGISMQSISNNKGDAQMTMSSEPARRGFTAMTRSARKNPLLLLGELREADPTASSDRIFQVWWNTIREDDDFLLPVGRHAFENMWGQLERDEAVKKARSKTDAQRQADEAERKRAADAIKEQLKTAAVKIALDMVMPNGKLLRANTFGYCAKLGGGLARLGKSGKPDQIVGKVLNEKQVRALLGAAVT